MSFRSYREVTGEDASRLGEQVARQRRRVEERLAEIRRVVAVVSGKGGVGKSHVTAALALGSAPKFGGRVGVLDADLEGPTVATLLGAAGPLKLSSDGVHPATGRADIKVVSTSLLLEEGQPLRWRDPGTERFVWRGTLEAGTLREFLADVLWGPLDLLLVDLPPGGHRLEDLADVAPMVAGLVAVTIPSDESRRTVERSLATARERGLKILGVVENMSGYRCSGCDATGALFPGNAGEALAAAFGVPLLTRVPFHPEGGPDADAATLADALEAVLP